MIFASFFPTHVQESEQDLLTMARLAALEHLNRRFFLYIRGKEEVVRDAEYVAGVSALMVFGLSFCAIVICLFYGHISRIT